MLQSAGGVDPAGAHMHNLAAALFARGCKEMHLILTSQGANPEFAYSLPGAGDMYVTATGGRSVTLGKLLGTGMTYDEALHNMAGETLEAAMIIQQMGLALPAFYAKEILNQGDLPLMELLVDLVVRQKALDLNLDVFFQDVII